MSYRLDFTVIGKNEQQSRFALILHNLSERPLQNWSLNFALRRWINADSVSHGQLSQLGSYCILKPENSAPLAPNAHYYTEFTINTEPFTLHDDGIIEAFLTTAPCGGFIRPIPVEVTPINLGQATTERFTTPLPAAKPFSLIPAPSSLTPLDGEFRLNQHTAIKVQGDKAAGSARWLQAEQERLQGSPERPADLFGQDGHQLPLL